MTEPRRLINLPGYDTGADVFETPDLTDDTSTTVRTQRTSSSSEQSDTSGEDDDEGYGVSRRRLYPERARSRFGREARGVRTRGADLSDRADGGRRGYRMSKRKDGEDGVDEMGEEGLEARIARLRREIEECRIEAEKEVDGRVEEDREGAVEEVDGLSRLLAGIGVSNSRVKEKRPPAPKNGAPPGQYPASEEEEEMADEQTLGRVVDFDSRLAAFEQALGISALDSVTTNAISAPILPSLTLLDQQLSALNSATSLANLEAASSRIQKLKAERESFARSQTSPFTATNGETEDGEPIPLSQEDVTKLQSLYQLLPTLQSLSPTVPALLTRLRSLRTLHTSAANAASELDDVEKRQREMDKELAVWKEGLEKVETAVQEADEANGRNGKVVEGWVRELEGRMKVLPR